jgi:cobaltochelatase CobS
MSEHDTRPAHQRLENLAVRHLVGVLKHLCNGHIGFDTARDERTNTKQRLVAYIRQQFTSEQIDAAHEAVRATYGGHNGGGYRGSRRRRGSNVTMGDTGADAVETASDFEAKEAEHAANAAKQQTAASTSGTDTGAITQQMAALFQSLAASQVSEDKVRSIVESQLAAVMADMQSRIDAAVKAAQRGATVVELKQAELPPIKLGTQHQKFPLLLKACNSRLRDGTRLNVWLAGPAGTGKTTAAKNVAAALKLPFRFNGAIDSPYKLTGFTDANGRTIRTPFREAWEHGGVYLFDEVDASSPSAILEFNAALANGVCAFPDAIVERHPDCIVIAGANTTGLGASTEYVGRMKQDAAFLDRFVCITWELDPALESAMCANDAWTARVRSVRERVKARGIRGALVTPRATQYGEALLAAGIDMKTVEAMTLRKGLNDEQWGQVS